MSGNSSARQLWYLAMSDSSVPSVSTPLLLFLSGGPGVPAANDVFFGTGPYRLTCAGLPFAFPCTTNYTVEKSIRSPVFNGFNQVWLENAGVGFSFSTDGSFPRNSFDVGQDLFDALQHYAVLKDSLLDPLRTPLFVVGHSYGAKSALCLSSLLMENSLWAGALSKGGVILASGLVDTVTQAQAWPQQARQLLLIGDIEAEAYAQRVQTVVNLIEQKQYSNASMLYYPLVIEMVGAVQLYDDFGVTPIPNMASSFLGYLMVANSTLWRSHWNARPIPPSSTQDGWAEAFYQDVSVPYQQLLSPLLAKDVRVLVTGAEADVIVCSRGVADWLNLAVSGFAAAPTSRVCAFPDVPGVNFAMSVGTERSVGSLQFRMLKGGGHFYQADQPLYFLDMLRQFAGLDDPVKCP